MTYPRNWSASTDGSVPLSAETRKSVHNAGAYKVSFDECSYQLTTLTVERSVRLGMSGTEFVHQLATISVRGVNSGNLRRKGVVAARLNQIISVAAQVTISR